MIEDLNIAPFLPRSITLKEDDFTISSIGLRVRITPSGGAPIIWFEGDMFLHGNFHIAFDENGRYCGHGTTVKATG